MDLDEFNSSEKFPIVVVLDNIRSHYNVGAIFRNCDAFRVSKIYLCGITPTPPHREISKTAIGAEKSVSWEKITDNPEFISRLKSENYTLCAIEQTSNSLELAAFNPQQKKLALVFGNEVEGVQNVFINACDFALEIPQFGTKHSFNVAVTSGIVLYDLVNKLPLPDAL